MTEYAYDSLEHFISPNPQGRSNKFVFKVTEAFKRKTWILHPYQSMARQITCSSTGGLQLTHPDLHRLFGRAAHAWSTVLLPMLQNESLENQQLIAMPSSQQGMVTPLPMCGFFWYLGLNCRLVLLLQSTIFVQVLRLVCQLILLEPVPSFMQRKKMFL